MQEKDFDYDYIEVLCADLKIIFITDETMQRSGSTNVHTHSLWEMFYLQEGSMEVNSEDGQYLIQKNQLMIIPPNRYHSTSSTPEAVKKSVYFTFEKVKSAEKESIFNQMNKVFSGCGFYRIDDGGYVGLLLDILLDNYSSDNYGKKWRLQSNVTELMFTIYDMIKDGAVTSPESEIRPNTYWVYKYALDRLLDIYYMTDISLDDLSEKLFVSSKTISRIISAAYGKSFNDMKFELRIRNAKKLLRETSLSVSQIGEKVGYTTDRGFFSAFQKYEGCTPGEYRKNNK